MEEFVAVLCRAEMQSKPSQNAPTNLRGILKVANNKTDKKGRILLNYTL
jgi:hypothetical protein